MSELLIKLQAKFNIFKAKLQETEGSSFFDSGIKIIIGIVVGGLVIAGLTALIAWLFPLLQDKMDTMFNAAP